MEEDKALEKAMKFGYCLAVLAAVFWFILPFMK
jgi:hypothetical protein